MQRKMALRQGVCVLGCHDGQKREVKTQEEVGTRTQAERCGGTVYPTVQGRGSCRVTGVGTC